MAINISDGALEQLGELVSRVSFLDTIIQFIGGIVVVYSIYLIISLIWQRKRNKEVTEIKEIVKRIEKKIDRL